MKEWEKLKNEQPQFTVEQIMEMDEYHKQGKEHPLEANLPSWTEQWASINKYGRQAMEYLQENNPPKYRHLVLTEHLLPMTLELQDRIEAFMEQRIESRPHPTSVRSYQENCTMLTEYRSETERMIFTDFIVPFAAD
ncbi:MAG: TnpV protein [Christensenellaceae bacterium]